MAIDPKEVGGVPGDGLPRANAVGVVRSMDAEKRVQVAQLVAPSSVPAAVYDVLVLGALGIMWMMKSKPPPSPPGGGGSQGGSGAGNVQVSPAPPENPEEPGKKKKATNSEKGEKVRTPDTHPDDFTKLKNGQGYVNNNTGESWVPSNTTHKGDTWKVYPSFGSGRSSVKPDGTIVGD